MVFGDDGKTATVLRLNYVFSQKVAVLNIFVVSKKHRTWNKKRVIVKSLRWWFELFLLLVVALLLLLLLRWLGQKPKTGSCLYGTLPTIWCFDGFLPKEHQLEILKPPGLERQSILYIKKFWDMRNFKKCRLSVFFFVVVYHYF